ncbi:MAG: hypothetical protein ACRD12_17185 [Acidimicrobiales bacterium]
MTIGYYISARGNNLYHGKHPLRSRFMTFGQHSYIVDFARCARHIGVELHFGIEGVDDFPISASLRRVTNVRSLDDGGLPQPDTSALILDTVSDEILARVPAGVPTVSIVHDAGTTFSDDVLDRTDRFICMTPNAVALQANRIDPDRLVLIPQGVDLRRFVPEHRSYASQRVRVLLYTRLASEKRALLMEIIDCVVGTGASMSVLGDGSLFWEVSDTFGEFITLLNFVPCQSIHNFIRSYDVVISSGRGVMEALACGIPAICAGFGYGGLVDGENIEGLLRYNLTGWSLPVECSGLSADLAAASQMDALTCRALAEKHFDADRSVERIVGLLDDLSR